MKTRNKKMVTLDIVVKETARRLCSLSLAETDSLSKVKEEILRKNKRVVVKNLFIKEEQCIGRIVKLFIKDTEWDGADTATLKSLEMTNGHTYSMTVRFVRALAFLSEREMRDLVREAESRTQRRYPRELIVQAINMAPECTLAQTSSNLVNNAVRVFESILQAESK